MNMDIPGAFPDLRGEWAPDSPDLPDSHNWPHPDNSDQDIPKRKALKEEYVSPEWKAWREGTTGLTRPDQPVDIIAVQGLASTYERTWTKKSPDGRRDVMWLRDLLPKDLPLARIMTFEYNSQWLDNPAQVTLEQCAEELLQAIVWDRSHHGEDRMCKMMRKRPLIFVGHSYGGLVIKKAMVCAAKCDAASNSYDDWQSIVTSTSGIVYLGTPHDGSMLAEYGIYQASLWNRMGRLANPAILKPLELGSKTSELRDLQSSFLEIRDKERLAGLIVFHFWETEPLTIGGWKIAVVVDKHSACLGTLRSERAPLAANHKDMNKFSSREESNYGKVRDCLRAIYSASKDIVGRRWGRYQYDGKYAGDKLLQLKNNWLVPFASADGREQTLRGQRFEGTCEWAAKLEAVSKWLDPSMSRPQPGAIQDGRCLWVHGKPGSGKSVLSTFLHDQVQALVTEHNKSAIQGIRCSGEGDSASCTPALRAELWTALYFPFHGAANFKQSVATLVHRLLRQHPENEELLGVVDIFRENTLTVDVAVNLFRTLLEMLSLTYIIIDGLDECTLMKLGMNQYEETKAMLEHLKGLCELSNVRLLMLSREEPLIRQFTMESLCSDDATLNVASHNSSDINLFIDFHVSAIADKANLPDDLKQSIQLIIEQRARGMFQWVKLVIQQLKVQVQQIKGSVREKDDKDIMEMLEMFPTDLNEAYQKTLDQLSGVPGHKPDRAVVALKWLSCAWQPLTLYELTLAIELHEEMKGPTKPASKVVESVLDRVSKYSEETMENRFTFLLGPLAEFQQQHNITHVVDLWGNYSAAPKTINICHHSLAQFLFSKNSEGFRFPGQSAHSLLAATCMQIMCSQNAFEAFLEHYPDKDWGHDARRFLNYAVEYWSHHLRASGIRYDEDDLTDLTVHVLDQSLSFSLLVMGALSDACRRLSGAKARQMMQAIAIRDCQAAMLPAINSVIKLQPCLGEIARHLRKINTELRDRGRLRAGTLRSGRLQGDNVDDAIKVPLSEELDSQIMLDIFFMVDSHDDAHLFKPIKEQLSQLRQTSRELRGLTIKLCVDPIRSWLYEQIGEGINPIPALAMTTHNLDVLLASSLLPSTSRDRSDFRDQFFAEPSHPLYGFIASTRYCLDGQWKNVLTAADYKEHVLSHYLLRKPEWWAISMTTMILEFTTSHNGYYLNLMIQSWHHSTLMIAYEGDNQIYTQASTLFGGTTPRDFTNRLFTSAEMLRYGFTLFVAYIVKITTILFPSIEDVFMKIFGYFEAKRMLMKPWIIALVQGWRHSSIALPLYLLRLSYFPWLFGYPRNTPWIDLVGIIRDPYTYKPIFQKRSWAWIIFFVGQELIIGGILIYDAFQLPNAPGMNDDPDGPPRTLYRRVSFRIRSTYDSIMDVIPDLLPHGREILMAAARMIFIERALFELSYIFYDILEVSVRLLSPSGWSWTRVTTASSTLLGNVVGKLFIQRYGLGKALSIMVQVWIYSKICGWMHIDFSYVLPFYLAGEMRQLPGLEGASTLLARGWILYKLSGLVPKSFVSRLGKWLITYPTASAWKAVRFPFVATYAVCSYCASAVAWFALLVAGLLGPRGTVFLVSFTLLLSFAFFIFIITDPLQLRTAASSCSKASRIAAQITGEQYPLKSLHWKAGSGRLIESQPLVDLDQMNKLGAEEKPAPRASEASGETDSTGEKTQSPEAIVEEPWQPLFDAQVREALRRTKEELKSLPATTTPLKRFKVD